VRSRTALVLVIFALAALAALWRWREPHGKTTNARGSAPGTAAAERARGALTGPAADQPAPPAWFVADGVKPRRIAGRVTLDEKPAAKATVTLTSMLTRAGRTKAVDVSAAADGTFDLGTWPAGRYMIIATAPDVRGAVLPLDLADLSLATDALELRLHACDVRLSGVVSDAVGAPIEGAKIGADGFAVAITDAKGAYSICVPWGDLNLEYSADGYGAVVLGFWIVGSTTQDVVLVPAAAVAGRVIRADDGTPVADAMIGINPQEWARDRPASRNATTDASGRFRVEGLVPGLYRAWAFADGLSSEGASPVEAQLGVTNEVVIKLVDRTSLRGSVVLDGKPLPGVSVTAVRHVPTSRSRPTRTHPDGTFVLDDVPIGDLVFAVDGYEVTSPSSYRAVRGAPNEGVTIEVAAMAAIRGVVTRGKKPVEGAQVWGVATPSGGNGVTTDVDGHYEITGVAPGTYHIGAGSDEAGAFKLPVQVTVAAGEQKTLDLELDLAAEIAGTVVDAGGKPVEGAFVRWTHTTTQDEGRGSTDANGRYRCRAMQGDGTYKARVFPTPAAQRPYPPAPGTTYPDVAVADGATKIEGITLAIDRQSMSIAGVVVDATGAPVVDAQVKAGISDGGDAQFAGWRRLPTTATDSDGGFVLNDLLPGTYSVHARSSDGGEGIATDIAAGTRSARVVLTRPGSIEGQLVGYAQPAVVYATPWNAPQRLLPGTVDGAMFHIPGVKPGRYLVNAQNANEGDAALVDVRAGAKATVTLTSNGHGVIEGKVLDWKTHAPLEGAVCHAVTSVDGQAGLTNWDMASAPKSDASGRLVVDPAPAGDVIVSCTVRQPLYSSPAVEVSLPRGGRASVELYGVELTVENPGGIGADFHWASTTPRLLEVVPGGPAARAGLANGDIVVAVDGASVAGLNGPGVAFLILNHPIGTKANITVLRGAQKKTVDVEIEGSR
jgi:protocatechuate 3,4-dioxygenase beta subunit